MRNPPSYINKLAETSAKEKLNQNKNKIEPNSDLVDNALMCYNMKFRSNEDQEPVLENYEIDNVNETKELTDNTQDSLDMSISHIQLWWSYYKHKIS